MNLLKIMFKMNMSCCILHLVFGIPQENTKILFFQKLFKMDAVIGKADENLAQIRKKVFHRREI